VTEAAPPNEFAKALFAPIAPTYDRYARLLSLGQDPRWRHFLVSRLEAGPGERVLDVATGTGAVAIEIARRTGAHVVGLDQSPRMLASARERVARARLDDRIELVEGRAEELPFADGSFAALSFTYLLRYVADPAATMRELARVVRPGGVLASLEFGVPPRALPRAAWEMYVRVGLPVAGTLVSGGWKEVGRFLGPSIREFYRDRGLERTLDCWLAAGIEDLRYRRLSLGGGIVTWGRRR
jgi:demethylmenaquinone methyltransferase/2-methoxy-6-polyprenyl-1,4-benzoquinol methylase